MTPAEAAEGRRLLENRLAAEGAVPHLSRDDSALTDWLWAHRDELVRYAEERAQLLLATPGGQAKLREEILAYDFEKGGPVDDAAEVERLREAGRRIGERMRADHAHSLAVATPKTMPSGIDPLPWPHPIPDVRIRQPTKQEAAEMDSRMPRHLREPQGLPVGLHCHGCTDDMCPGCCDCEGA